MSEMMRNYRTGTVGM